MGQIAEHSQQHGADSSLNGLATLNVELTARCNKNCWFCGCRQSDREKPERAAQYGDIDFGLLENIAAQTPPGIVVQFHRDGESLLYPRFGEAVALFEKNVRNLVTNGKLLLKKNDEIIGNLETLSVSVFENDNEAAEQLEILREFLARKKQEKPNVSLRLIGNVDSAPYEELGLLIIRRAIHHPMGTFGYVGTPPMIPEIGVCWDFLQHPSISSNGNLSICQRLDTAGTGVLGNLKTHTLAELWNGPLRAEWKTSHVNGRRTEVPLCAKCDYWGVPT